MTLTLRFMATNNTIFVDPENIRLRCGLSRNQWTRLLDAVDQPDEERAWVIGQAFDRFLEQRRSAVDIEFREPEFHGDDGTPLLSTIQAARALGVGEFHLANLRDRGKLNSTRVGRRAGFAREDLRDFLNIDQKPETRQTALGIAFLRWFEVEELETAKRRRVKREAVTA